MNIAKKELENNAKRSVALIAQPNVAEKLVVMLSVHSMGRETMG